MGTLGPGYRSLPLIRQEELRQEREAASEDDGLETARDLDADAVARRAEQRRLEREAAREPSADERTGLGGGRGARP